MDMAAAWQMPRHVKALNDALVDVAERRTKRLLVTMPPRHGKSIMVSHYFPAWYLGWNPDHRIILAGYGSSFAADWGRKARSVLEEFGPSVFGVSVSDKSHAADRWDIAGHRGGMYSVGIGGPCTGRGADVLIIDDPVKSMAEANSDVYRRKAWEWFNAVAYTRLAPGAPIVLVQTRWHEDDLSGRLLAENQDDKSLVWRSLNMPAQAEENDPLGRSPGEWLWPERFSPNEYEAIRKRDSYTWSALYQQRPSPAAGNIFKRSWFKFFDRRDGMYVLEDGAVAIDDCHVFGTVDLALSQKTSADYTVIGAWAVTPRGDMLLLDMHRERMEAPSILPAIRNMIERHSMDYVAIEAVAFQASIVQAARREGIVAKKLNPKGDKITRAISAAPRFEAGMVYLPNRAGWVDEYVDELISFPNAKHDDQVDMTSYACHEAGRLYGTSRLDYQDEDRPVAEPEYNKDREALALSQFLADD